jgi:hypothetical protein
MPQEPEAKHKRSLLEQLVAAEELVEASHLSAQMLG